MVFAQDDNIVGQGDGQGTNHDEALMAAKRDAIEKGIGTILLSQTEIENFQLKRDQVITKTIGAVKSYEVLSEIKQSDGVIEIKIKALISKVAMRNDLASFQILLESMDKPKVMIVIKESHMGNDQAVNQVSESVIIRFLKDPYGFEMVDPNVTSQLKASQAKMASLAGNDAAAAALECNTAPRCSLPETLFLRKVIALVLAAAGMVSGQGDVTLKAINCTTGRMIGSESGHGAFPHISPETAGDSAIAKASRVAIGKLLDAIIKDWQDQLNNGVPIVSRSTRSIRSGSKMQSYRQSPAWPE